MQGLRNKTKQDDEINTGTYSHKSKAKFGLNIKLSRGKSKVGIEIKDDGGENDHVMKKSNYRTADDNDSNDKQTLWVALNCK